MGKRFLCCYFLLFSWACHSPEELLLTGKYDAAIRSNARNLRKTERVVGLEKAYQAAQNSDFEKIDALLHQDSIAAWPEIHAGYQRIKKRQYDMAARMPIRSRDGYAPQFDWLENIDSLERNAREQAADQIYADALLDMEHARAGNQLAARTAYARLHRLTSKYFPVWRESTALLAEAERIGTDYVLFQQNSGYAFEGVQFLSDLNLSWNLRPRAWLEYHSSPQTGILYRYIAKLSVESLHIGFENRDETTRTEEKDIETGVKLSYDSSGQVIDRTPIYEKVQANIKETRITKNSSVRLCFELFDAQSSTLRYWDCTSVSNDFDKTWVEVSGDQRALSTVYFPEVGFPNAPSNWSMVSALADAARSTVLGWFWTAPLPY